MSEPDASVRVSDAERDAVLRTLGDHAAVGRLTLDELEERSGRALAAKTRGELTINIFSLMGGSNVYVPDSVDVEVGGFSVMGGHEEVGAGNPPRPGSPVIRIRVWSLMGGASVYRLPAQARGVGLTEARRLSRAAEHGQLPAPG